MTKTKFLSLDKLSLQDFDENSELIPLMTPEDEAEINNEELPESLPILPLRNTVLFLVLLFQLLLEEINPSS